MTSGAPLGTDVVSTELEIRSEAIVEVSTLCTL